MFFCNILFSSLRVSTCGSKFDLIIGDPPKGLPMANVSSPPQSIIDWNKHDWSHIEDLFTFVSAYLANNACMLLTTIELKVARKDTMTYFATHNFTTAKDQWGVDDQPL